MSTAATATALANRSIRTIRAELEFLADTSIISYANLSHILSLLPAESSTRCPPTPAAGPAPKSTTPAVPYPTFSPPPSVVSEKYPSVTPSEPSASPASSAPPSYTPTALVLSIAEAQWAFRGTETGDLTFEAGDKLEVLEKVKEDWWKGRITGGDGTTGLFPSSYVRETQILASPSDSKKPVLPSLPPRGGYSGYGPGGNMMTDIAHGPTHGPTQGTSVFEQQQQEQKGGKPLMGKNGEKFGKKLGNAAIFGAGATIGGKIVSGIL